MADLKGRMQAFYDGFNARDIDSIEELMASDFVEHEVVPGMPTDNTAPRAYMEIFTAAFPDFQMSVDDMIQEGNKVVTRGRMTGTHQGDFMGMPPSGKSFDIGFIDIVEFRDDKAIGHWGLSDNAAMMEQLGAGG